MTVKPIPDGYHNVTPFLLVQGVPKLLDFLREAFGAKEIVRTGNGPGMHAEVRIGDSVVMMGDVGDGARTPAAIYLYVENVDETYRRAVTAGAASQREPADQSYGDRSAAVTDPCGNTWFIATHIRDVQN